MFRLKSSSPTTRPCLTLNLNVQDDKSVVISFFNRWSYGVVLYEIFTVGKNLCML